MKEEQILVINLLNWEPFVKDAGGVVSHSQRGNPSSILSRFRVRPSHHMMVLYPPLVLCFQWGHSGYGPLMDHHIRLHSHQELADALCTLCRLCAFRGSPYSYTDLRLSLSDDVGAVMGVLKLAIWPISTLLRILCQAVPIGRMVQTLQTGEGFTRSWRWR